MSPAYADVFRAQGLLRLDGFHPTRHIAAVRQKLLDEIKRLKEPAGGKGLPASLQKLPVFQQIGKLSSLVRLPGLHEALVGPELIEVLMRLAGRMPSSIQDTQLLLSPPNQGAWTLEGLNWHVDISARPQDRLLGIQAFFLIDDVAPRGGATLALAGSHRIGTRHSGAPSALREALGNPADLERRLQALGITVVEMCGRAGDVFLMDMRVLHTPSVNSTRNLRMMATARCFLQW